MKINEALHLADEKHILNSILEKIMCDKTCSDVPFMKKAFSFMKEAFTFVEERKFSKSKKDWPNIADFKRAVIRCGFKYKS